MSMDDDVSHLTAGAAARDLLVFGMMIQNCVVFTALSGLNNGPHVQVIGDLCTAPIEVVHRIALNALGSKLRVSNAEDVWG